MPIDNAIENNLSQQLDRLADEIIRLSLKLHSHPELAFGEHFAVQEIIGFLAEQGFEIQRNTGNLPTAFKAIFPKGAQRRPAIAFIAEYDALPDLGHACGHNLIAAASIGAAAALSKIMQPEWGSLVVMGAPAEERGGGKILLADRGAFDGLDAALMFHPDAETRIIKRALAMTSLEVEFTGRAAHAAANPESGRNALDGVILSFNNINALRQYIPEKARIHGIITHGGQAANIIPDRATAAFMVRSLELSGLDYLTKRVVDCIQGAALASGTEVKISRPELIYAPYKPNYTLADIFRKNLERLGLSEDPGTEWENIGSTDVGNVSQIVPVIQPVIAICERGIPGHSPQFAAAAASPFGQQRMLLAAKALAGTALRLMTDKDALEKVAQEFMKQRA